MTGFFPRRTSIRIFMNDPEGRIEKGLPLAIHHVMTAEEASELILAHKGWRS